MLLCSVVVARKCAPQLSRLVVLLARSISFESIEEMREVFRGRAT
jgi:hypothetical protein